jgi:hypothetical protein
MNESSYIARASLDVGGKVPESPESVLHSEKMNIRIRQRLTFVFSESNLISLEPSNSPEFSGLGWFSLPQNISFVQVRREMSGSARSGATSTPT